MGVAKKKGHSEGGGLVGGWGWDKAGIHVGECLSAVCVYEYLPLGGGGVGGYLTSFVFLLN